MPHFFTLFHENLRLLWVLPSCPVAAGLPDIHIYTDLTCHLRTLMHAKARGLQVFTVWVAISKDKKESLKI